MLRSEYVVAVEGLVALRTPETVNPNIPTGEVEVVADKIWILNESRTPPFPMEDSAEVSEDARLKYRYVDLRARACSVTSSCGRKFRLPSDRCCTRRASSKSRRHS